MLLLVACLITAPGECREVRLGEPADPAPLACIFGAQQRIAAWCAEHPAFEVKSWRCGRPTTRA